MYCTGITLLAKYLPFYNWLCEITAANCHNVEKVD